jgi:hypothetical protein
MAHFGERVANGNLAVFPEIPSLLNVVDSSGGGN